MLGRNTGRLMFGLVVLSVGVLFTLDNLGILDSWDFLQWWPLLVIASGAWRLVQSRSTSAVIGGLIVTFIGVLLLDQTVNILPGRVWNYWPVLLILFGASLMVRAWSGPRVDLHTDPSAKFNSFAMMSGVERKITSQEFVGGDATAIMGGVDIDLRQAKIANGPAVIDVFAFWGGIDFYVPSDWVVRNEAVAIMGAISDSRKSVTPESGGPMAVGGVIAMGGRDSGVSTDANRTLVIRGGALMGGVEIKN